MKALKMIIIIIQFIILILGKEERDHSDRTKTLNTK